MPKHNSIALLAFIFAILSAIYIKQFIAPHWVEQSYVYDVSTNNNAVSSYIYKGQKVIIEQVVDYQSSPLNQSNLSNLSNLSNSANSPTLEQQWVRDKRQQLKLLKPAFHFGVWSLLPAFITIALCLLTREPLTALLGGVVVGAIMLGRYDLTGKVIIPNLAKEGTAALLLLYLWLLGGLLGIWSKTGAAQAFANYMTKHFVKGKKSAKLVSWLLGILFFQGGTMSTVLVGTTVRPLADQAKVSHEEMSRFNRITYRLYISLQCMACLYSSLDIYSWCFFFSHRSRQDQFFLSKHSL
jgi:hypothetical protein